MGMKTIAGNLVRKLVASSRVPAMELVGMLTRRADQWNVA